MDPKDFFKQLREQLQNHPLRDRFLEELEDHAEDIKEDSLANKRTKKYHYFESPRNVKKEFYRIMYPCSKWWSITLYGFSLYGLKMLLTLLLNGFLVPWDGTISESRPTLGSLERTVNDFFEQGMVIETMSYFFIGISVAILFWKLKKETIYSPYKIVDYMGTLNFLYIGIIFASAPLFILISPQNMSFTINAIFLSAPILALLALFYTQYKGLGLSSKIVLTQ